METLDHTKKNDLKIILLGESGVGKTNLINVVMGKQFEQNTLSSQSGSYFEGSYDSKELGKSYVYNLWDTAGQEVYRSLNKIFINGSKIVMVVYAINNKKSFEEVDYWINYVRDILGSGNDYILALIANKSDLYEEDQVVNDDEGESKAHNYNIKFKVTSALTDAAGFKLFLHELIDDYIKLVGPEGEKLLYSTSLKITAQNTKKGKKKCC